MRQETYSLDIELGATGDAFPVRDMVYKTVAIGGSFAGTVKVDGLLGGVWKTLVSSATADILEISKSVTDLRTDTTGVTGTPTVTLSGFNTRAD